MTQDKKFRISVDDQKIRELRQTANELARDMIVSARQYSTSSKQVVQDIEEQIRLIEKRNRTDKEIERTKIDTQFSAGRITGEQRKEAIGRIHSESKVDDLQISLLRDIIDAIKQTAKDEIREDRVNVEKRIRESKTVDQLSPKIDPEQALRETIQKGLIGEVGREEATEKRDFIDFGRVGGKADSTLATVAGSQNEYSLMAAGAGAVLGAGAGVAADRLFQAANRFQQSAATLGRHTGEGIDAATDKIVGMGGRQAYLTPSQVAERFTQYRIAGGGKEFSEEQMSRAYIAERQLGVGIDDISGVVGTTRYNRQDPTRIMAQLEAHLRRTSQDISVLPELMKQYTSTANSILQVSTSGNVGRVASGMISLAEMTGAKGTELSQWIGGVQGLGTSQNPMVRAMLMRAFSEKNPDKSMFEIQAMMENPMAHLDVVGSAFSEIQGQTGGDMARQAIYSLFGGKVSRSAILAAEKGGGFDFSKLGSGGAGTQGASIMERMEVAKFTPIIEKSSSRLESVVEITGNKVVTALDKFLNGVLNLLGVDVPSWSEEDMEKIREGYKERYGDNSQKVLMEEHLKALEAIKDNTPTREESRRDMKDGFKEAIMEVQSNKVTSIDQLF